MRWREGRGETSKVEVRQRGKMSEVKGSGVEEKAEGEGDNTKE